MGLDCGALRAWLESVRGSCSSDASRLRPVVLMVLMVWGCNWQAGVDTQRALSSGRHEKRTWLGQPSRGYPRVHGLGWWLELGCRSGSTTAGLRYAARDFPLRPARPGCRSQDERPIHSQDPGTAQQSAGCNAHPSRGAAAFSRLLTASREALAARCEVEWLTVEWAFWRQRRRRPGLLIYAQLRQAPLQRMNP